MPTLMSHASSSLCLLYALHLSDYSLKSYMFPSSERRVKYDVEPKPRSKYRRDNMNYKLEHDES